MNSQKIPCATINPDASADSLEAKQPDVDNGTACYSKEGYFTTEYMAREWNKLWTDTWLIAGVISDIPKVGDYFLFDVGEESIIVTRTEDGVRLFIMCARTVGPNWYGMSAVVKRYSFVPSTVGVFTTPESCAELLTKTPSTRTW